MSENGAEDVNRHLENASRGFNQLFNNALEGSQKTFSSHDSPFNLLGVGVVSFLEAALGMEVRFSIFTIPKSKYHSYQEGRVDK